MDALDIRIQVFLLALVRTTAALTSVPALNEHGLPPLARVALAALLSFLVLPAAAVGFTAAQGWQTLVVSVLGEVTIGLFIGLIISTLYEAVAIACRVVETQAGFALGGSIFAASGGTHSAFGSCYHAIALVLFFSSGAYRELLRGLASTFATVPLGTIVFAPGLVSAGTHMFAAAVHFGAPIVCGILLTDLALGLLSRAAPQMNVFAVGFPVKIAVALALATASLSIFAAAFSRELHTIMARLFGGGLGS